MPRYFALTMPARRPPVFESSELAAQAIAFDSKDNLYVGTSPDGKVYKVTPDGQKSVFFDPKTKYIWALGMDSHGSLFVATGDKGEVFVVTPDGKGQVFYQSDERHARSLAFDSKGNLLIGTEPSGLILRVELQQKSPPVAPTAGRFFRNLRNQQIRSHFPAHRLQRQSVRRIGGRKDPGPVSSAHPARASGTKPGAGGQRTRADRPSRPRRPQPAAHSISLPAVSGGAEVVKIAPDGSPETLWTSREDDLVYAMGLTPAGKLLLGTGEKGTIIELEGDQIYSSVAKTASAEVTSFVSGPGGKIFAATANAGKVFALGPGYESNGSFESNTFDAKIFSRWGRLTWWGENGAMQGKVAFYARSGNTSNPEINWSAWAGPYKTPDASEVKLPTRSLRPVEGCISERGRRQASRRLLGRPRVSTKECRSRDRRYRPAGPRRPRGRILDAAQRPGNFAARSTPTPHGPGANPSSSPAGADSTSKAR